MLQRKTLIKLHPHFRWNHNARITKISFFSPLNSDQKWPYVPSNFSYSNPFLLQMAYKLTHLNWRKYVHGYITSFLIAVSQTLSVLATIEYITKESYCAASQVVFLLIGFVERFGFVLVCHWYFSLCLYYPTNKKQFYSII